MERLTKEEFFELYESLSLEEIRKDALDSFNLSGESVKSLTKKALLGLMWDRFEALQKPVETTEGSDEEREWLLLSNIRIDGGTQVREKIDSQVVQEYAEAMEESSFPPVVVFYDGETYWMGDGFHRYCAVRERNQEGMECSIREGGKREALFWALGANVTHGLRMTNADKRKKGILMLQDPEWKNWSDQEVARHCGVSGAFVGNLRRELGGESGESRRVKRGKQDYEVNVGKQGRPKVSEKEEPKNSEEEKLEDNMQDLLVLGKEIDRFCDFISELSSEEEPHWLTPTGGAPIEFCKKMSALITVCEEFLKNYDL